MKSIQFFLKTFTTAPLTIIEVFYSLDTKAFQGLNTSVKHENKKSTSSFLRRQDKFDWIKFKHALHDPQGKVQGCTL